MKKIKREYQETVVKLSESSSSKEYQVTDINTLEEGMKEFLFTLGCYQGEKITIISQVGTNFIVSLRDARYSIDEHLASAIIVQDADAMDAGSYNAKVI